MSKRGHATARSVAVGILAVLLTGCIKLNVDFNVSSDNKVSGTMVFAFSKQLLELTGQSADQLIGSSAPIPSDVQGVSAKPYDDGEFAGEEFTFEGVPLEQFNSDDPEALSIVRQGDTFTVSGVLDLATGASGASAPIPGASGIPGIDEALAGADIRISITFPGAVTNTNGTVEGTTVTWTPKVGQRLELTATAGATGSGSSSTSSTLLIGGIVLGVIIVIVVIALIMKRRKESSGGDMVPDTTPMPPSEAPALQAPPSTPPPPSMPPPAPPPGPPPAPTTEAAPPEMPPPPSEGS
jgi:hypothetical protein